MVVITVLSKMVTVTLGILATVAMTATEAIMTTMTVIVVVIKPRSRQ